MAEPILEARNIYKSFGINNVLEDVTVRFFPGEVHSLLGVNGAGKSTLVKILQGVYKQDKGEVLLNGRPVVYKGPADALNQGISMVFQELNVFGEISVTENIIGNHRIKKHGLIDWKACRKSVRKHLDDLGISIDENAKVKDLTLANQQLVEIARCVYDNPRILFLDEPSSSLSKTEEEILYRLIRKLKQTGICVVLITHKLEEVFELSDYLSVLRDGHVTASGSVSEFTVDSITGYMLGKTVDIFKRSDVTYGNHDKILLSVENLSIPRKFKNVTFDLYEGEILAFAGLVGSGKSDLARTIFGANGTRYTGTVKLEGSIVELKTPHTASELGIGYVPISRKEEGIFENYDAKGNISSAMIDRFGVFVDREKETGTAEKMMLDFNVHPNNLSQNIVNFSGGNQQKLVLSRWIAAEKKIVLLDEPTRGVDVGAKQEIYDNLRRLASQGIGIIIFSSETNELLSSSDRIIVMREGKIVKKLVTAKTTPEEILVSTIAEQQG